MTDKAKVTVGSKWRHSNGNEYEVVALANENTERPDEYPVTVVYEGRNGRIWSRRLSDWHRSMSPVESAECTSGYRYFISMELRSVTTDKVERMRRIVSYPNPISEEDINYIASEQKSFGVTVDVTSVSRIN